TRSDRDWSSDVCSSDLDMEFVSQLGSSTLDGLSYLGSLASLGARAAYYTLVAPFKGKPLRLQRAVSQAMDTGVRALPILSLITRSEERRVGKEGRFGGW